MRDCLSVRWRSSLLLLYTQYQLYIYGFVLPTRAYKVLTFATGHNLCSPFVAPTLRLMGTLSDLRYIQPRILPVCWRRYIQLAISVHNHCGPIGISNNVKMASHYDSIQSIQWLDSNPMNPSNPMNGSTNDLPTRLLINTCRERIRGGPLLRGLWVASRVYDGHQWLSRPDFPAAAQEAERG